MADDYVRRTAITHLSVDSEQRDMLEETIAEWKRGCQLATDCAWGRCNTKSDVQPLAYDVVREDTDLGSQHAILATHQAAEAITGCIERRANGKTVSKPTFTAPTVKYDTRTMTLFDDETVSLSTTESRGRCPLDLPDADDGYQRQYLDSDDWSVTESTLTARDGEFFLYIGFRRYKNENNGPGIPEAKRESLFESNMDADHGLGLYLVHELLLRYGGSIQLPKAGANGTEFAVELTVVQVANSPSSASTTVRRLADKEHSREGIRRPSSSDLSPESKGLGTHTP